MKIKPNPLQKFKKSTGKSYLNIGENIRTWRLIKGIEQKELARRIDKSVTTISNIENGVSDPNTKQLQDIADALEVEPIQLLVNPQQITVFSNNPQNSEVVIGNSTFHNTDKEIISILTIIMEKMTNFFTGNKK